VKFVRVGEVGQHVEHDRDDHVDLLATFEGQVVGELFFANTLAPDNARELVTTIKSRSEERVATLESIRPAPDAAARDGNVHPLLTLELGIAVHQAMVDVCTRFEQRASGTRRREPG
jgi:hypothetical protein